MSQQKFEPKVLEEKDELSEKLHAAEPADDVELAEVKQEVESQIDEINMQAVRRRKVRELRDMGYSGQEILKILAKGIKIDGKLRQFSGMTAMTISRDLEYIISEDLAADRDYPEKRAEMLAKYSYLYKRAVALALSDITMTKAAFLNVAKTVLDKISELEGINTAGKQTVEFAEISKPSKAAEELGSITTKEERDAINEAINKIFANGEQEADTGIPVFDEQPPIPARTGDNEGVPEKPRVHKRGRPPKAKQ